MNSIATQFYSAQRRQQGLATVLIALFIGIAVTAVSLSILHYIRSTQERQITAHAQTHSQVTAWTAVEALRQHLLSLDGAELLAFQGFNSFNNSAVISNVGDADDLVRAWVSNSIDNGDGSFDVTVELAAVDTSAQASSALQVVYRVTPKSDVAGGWESEIQLRDDTRSSGGSTINVDDGADFMVDGDFIVTGSIGSIVAAGSALNVLKATGDVTLDSNISAEEIWANGNVNILANGAAKKVYAAGDMAFGKGNVNANTANQMELIEANGNVSVGSSTTVTEVKARGTFSVSNGGADIGSITTGTDWAESLFTGPDARAYDPAVFDPSKLDLPNYPLNRVTITNARDIGPIIAKGDIVVGSVNSLDTLFTAGTANCNNENHKGVTASAVSNCPSTVALGSTVIDGTSTCFTNWDASRGPSGDGYAKNDLVYQYGVEFKARQNLKWESAEPRLNAGPYSKWEVTGNVHPSCNEPVLTYDPPVNLTSPAVGQAMPEIERFVMQEATINVWNLEKDANYAFKPPAAGSNKIIVTVNNVTGVAPGDYYLGTYGTNASGHREYICAEVDASGFCTAPATAAEAIPICGLGPFNDCFDYDAATETWTVRGANGLAMGVLWFEGNVEFQSGNLFNTVLATGNIKTTGNFNIVALNWAGFDNICTGNYSITYNTAKGGTATIDAQPQDETLGSHLPSNYCVYDKGVLTFKAQETGNAALVSGGQQTKELPFRGGDIDIGAESNLLGTVIAGDTIHTGGSTSIYGNFAALGLDESDRDTNDLSAETNIDTSSNQRDSFDASGITINPTLPSQTAGTAEIVWTRYR